jgi:hypothetical protein
MKSISAMKEGELYKIDMYRWLLPKWDRLIQWQDVATVMYLGKENSIDEHGEVSENHRFLADGKDVVVDSHFLVHLSPYNKETKKHV